MAKPKCKLVGQDGNVFNVIGRVSKALEGAGDAEKADEFRTKAFSVESYDEVLQLAMQYCEVY